MVQLHSTATITINDNHNDASFTSVTRIDYDPLRQQLFTANQTQLNSFKFKKRHLKRHRLNFVNGLMLHQFMEVVSHSRTFS